MDKYHANNPDKYIKWVKDNLSDIADVDKQLNGVAVLKCGKAINLHEAAPEVEVSNKVLSAIMVYGKGRKCACRVVPKWKEEPDYLTVMCSQFYTAKGNLVKMGNIDYTEEDSEHRLICNVVSGDSIIDCIDKWNENHKLLCFEVEDIISKH